VVILLSAALVAWSAVHGWKSHERAVFERNVLAHANGNGFVPVQMPDGAPLNTVLILAALNCPSDAAQRADAMARTLTEKGIPAIRSSNTSFSAMARTKQQIDLLNGSVVVSNGALPIIFVNGMGKANPSVEEVVSQYRESE